MAASIWDPHHHININKIEVIQHRAARFVLGYPWSRDSRDSINSMLLTIGWPSLYLCQKCARLVLMFKLLHNLLIISPEYLQTPSPVTTTRANHNFNFFIIKPPSMLTNSLIFQEQSPNGIIYLHTLLMNKHSIVLNNLCISISTYS